MSIENNVFTPSQAEASAMFIKTFGFKTPLL